MEYEPGDAAGVSLVNSSELINEVLTITGLKADETVTINGQPKQLYDALYRNVELSKITVDVVTRFLSFAPNEKLQKLTSEPENFKEYNDQGHKLSQLRQNSIACAALPMCGLAFAEAERYLPILIDKIDKILDANGILQVPISIRMTGCLNGCARLFLAEIAFVGRGPGKYNLYFGASFVGDRLNSVCP